MKPLHPDVLWEFPTVITVTIYGVKVVFFSEIGKSHSNGDMGWGVTARLLARYTGEIGQFMPVALSVIVFLMPMDLPMVMMTITAL